MLALLGWLTTPHLLVAVLSVGDGWRSDYDEARANAQASKKDLLLFFTQSDTKSCRTFEDQVASRDEFLAAVAKDYVLVRLDGPEKGEADARVEELRQLHDVKTFPTLVQATSEGHAYWTRSFEKGSGRLDLWTKPGAAAEAVAIGRELGRPILEQLRALIASHEKAAPEARWAEWDKLALALEQAGWPWQPEHTRLLIPKVRAAIEEDADNALGKQRRALEVLLEGKYASDADRAQARALDPKNKLGLLELVFMNTLSEKLSKKPSIFDATAGKGDAARETEFVEALNTLADVLDRSLKDLRAFVADYGFREEAHLFKCYWDVAFMGHNMSSMMGMVMKSAAKGGDGPDKKAAREIEQSLKRLKATAKSAAKSAKELGPHEEPVKVLDKILKD